MSLTLILQVAAAITRLIRLAAFAVRPGCAHGPRSAKAQDGSPEYLGRLISQLVTIRHRATSNSRHDSGWCTHRRAHGLRGLPLAGCCRVVDRPREAPRVVPARLTA